MSKIQDPVQNRKCLVLRHIDLVEHTKAALRRAAVDRSLAECHLTVLKRIGSDQGRRIRIDMKRNIK